jgi:hypothetical protein
MMATAAETKVGGGRFQALTGCRPEHVRILESLQLISPTKTEAGWRQFSMRDVKVAKAWVCKNVIRRKRT